MKGIQWVIIFQTVQLHARLTVYLSLTMTSQRYEYMIVDVDINSKFGLYRYSLPDPFCLAQPYQLLLEERPHAEETIVFDFQQLASGGKAGGDPGTSDLPKLVDSQSYRQIHLSLTGIPCLWPGYYAFLEP